MEKQNNNHNKDKIQKLVLFDDFKSKTEESISKSQITEDIDQKNQIKVSTELKTFGSEFQYTSVIANLSKAPITKVNVKLQFPQYLNLSRSIPPTLVNLPSIDIDEENIIEQVKIEYDRLNPDEKKIIKLFFLPLNLIEMGELKTIVAFVNYQDYIRAIDSDPIPISIHPINLQPKILPTTEVKDFINKPRSKRAIRSFGIASNDKIDYDYIFSRMDALLRSMGMQFIAKDKNRKIIWYFGTNIDTQTDVLVIGQISNRKIEWIVSCADPNLIITLLADLSHGLKDQLKRLGFLRDDMKIYEANCKACGYVLPAFPKKGKLIECEKCKLEQTIW